MPIVAIEAEMGARGTDIALQVAEALGMRAADGDLTSRVLERWPVSRPALDISEVRRPTLFERLCGVDIDVGLYTAAEILDAAARGSAILQRWCAAQVLRGIPHAVRVRVHAPLARRIADATERMEMDETLTRSFILESDRAREQAHRRRFGCAWSDPAAYDFCINSAQTPIDEAVERIVAHVREARRKEDSEAQQRLRNRQIEALAAATLRSWPATRSAGIGVHACNDELVVTGVVRAREERARILDALRYLDPGITVRSELRCADDYRTRTSSI